MGVGVAGELENSPIGPFTHFLHALKIQVFFSLLHRLNNTNNKLTLNNVMR